MAGVKQSQDHAARLARLKSARASRPDLNGMELARLAQVPVGSIYRLLAELGPGSQDPEPAPALKKASVSRQGKETVAESVSPNVRTLEDLLRICKVDQAVWEVERFTANKWEVAMRMKCNGREMPVHRPLFQVKAWLRRKQPVLDALKAARIFAAALKKQIKPVHVKRPAPAAVREHLYEVSIPDLHLGKLAWRAETGHADYDSDIAARIFRAAMDDLTAKAPPQVGLFVLPLGNDFFNVDGDSKATTAGTVQDEDGRWQKSFRAGIELTLEAVRNLARRAPVRVVMVAGNHDYQRIYYLGEVLAAAFAGTPHVTIDNSPAQRKYLRWGRTLIGWTHGDKEKRADLPMIMATERPQEWAATDHHEWHCGHLHKEMVQSFGSVIVRTLPSLCPPESWHASRGYIGAQRQACALSYDQRGPLAQVFHTVR